MCLGRLRVPLPRWISPRVTALEKAGAEGSGTVGRPCHNAEDQIDVAVQVVLPFLGRLIVYEGKLTRVEVRG